MDRSIQVKPVRRRSVPLAKAQEDGLQRSLASSRQGRRYACLFLFILLFYVCTLTDKAFDWISDGQVMFDTAVSLHEFGELGISPEVADADNEGRGASDFFGKYGLGLSVVEQVPLLFVSTVEKRFGEGKSNVLFPMMNMALTALTALLVAFCLRDLGFGFKTGALASLGFAFATPAWPYVSYDFSEPLQALCLTAALWFIIHATRAHPASRIDVALAGFALGFAVLTKEQLVVLIPSYAFYLLVRLKGSLKQKRGYVFWFALVLALWGGSIAGLNLYRYGSVFASGYGPVGTYFTTPLLDGLFGLLFSLNKGIVFYAPLSILVPWSLWKMRKNYLKEIIFFATVLVVHTVMASKWISWEGGASWGPRLLIPVLPLMIVCAALLLESVRWSLPLFAGCLVAGVFINLLGVLLNFLVWLNAVDTNQVRIPLEVRSRLANDYVEHEGKRWYRPYMATNYVPALSPILGHAWLLRLRYFEVPFSLKALDRGSPTPPPVVTFSRIEINLGLMKDPFFRSHLRSAHFWLYETLADHPREEIFSYPVYAVSIERQGDRAVAKGDEERAMECYARAARLMPNYASPALKLSRMDVQQGRVREAVETLRQYLAPGERNPDQERAVRLQLARIYEGAGYREAALEQYRTYLTLQPSEPNRIAIEQHITALAAPDRK